MLNSLKINTTSISVEYPRFKEWKLLVSYVPREELTEIRQRSVNIKIVNRVREEVVDTDKLERSGYVSFIVRVDVFPLSIIRRLRESD